MATSPAFQLASVYHCQSVFYTVSHDVRKGKCEKDWGILRFRHGPGSTSSLTMGSHDRRLATQSFNQAWAWDLFPDALRSQDVTGDQGGLKGNLALILALAAFSAQPNNVEDALKTGFKKGHWVRHNLPDGRRDERGVVVLVYEDPGRSSASILRGFEEGLVFA
ncbi:hypothetical protein L228DRAFT_250068 [Xylona heveae TC161]|uniref:Uncharacterized protein n=1 Tax=Xylona heveae (strain CBS 132557 / TC161) TaxID=1328760 RepID=A0A165AFA6_XYLHT|nr:hypothetical protein L228DRAFT_250068 [Xylona heveae TC161]KZF20382.1 hypothetical protein L228DRAFT_250068 [Xylona heveae TC161]